MLPENDAPWPPPALKPALDKFEAWDAWWAGDPDMLRAHYEAASGAGAVNRPSQYAGGLVGKLARFWWGRPTPDSEPEAKLHVPLAGDTAQAYADLLFGEAITATSEHKGSTDRLTELLDDGMHSRLLEGAETVAALGGGYLRPMWDDRIGDKPWLDAVSPDMAVPEWIGGRLAGVNFWRIVRREQRGQIIYRHIERHEPGWIIHRLYRGERDKIGRPVPLEESDATAALAGHVNSAGAIETGYKLLSAVYVPRNRPTPMWRKLPMLRPMGRSLFAGAEPLLDALDETYAAWMRDVRLAKGRVFVPENMLDNYGPGQGAGWDPDRQFYATVPGMLGGKDDRLTVVQFSIRVDEHRDTARELVNTIMRRAGLNGATLGEPGDGGPAITAKEVSARERRSMLSRERGIRYWKPELRHAFGALLAADKRAFRTNVDPHAPINVEFPDSVSEDLETLAGTADLLNRADSASTWTRVEVLHPDWTETQVREEVAAIQRERGPVLDAPFPGDGEDGDDPDADPDAGE
ncbi:hypothetical protein [Pseudonocardia sp. McavD-2-B]|uniref:hypothetical protein n=1 Tax=Pseudonocardia sp. McavD-2-B TaxID=2954499 RepID=UPI0020985730|nr:hypothetical protein [Pseudonocardia sp. McavD-2-B]MCO7195395.1 hypothetical protein [Pseudonocardia sp. McavD-2-B]